MPEHCPNIARTLPEPNSGRAIASGSLRFAIRLRGVCIAPRSVGAGYARAPPQVPLRFSWGAPLVAALLSRPYAGTLHSVPPRSRARPSLDAGAHLPPHPRLNSGATAPSLLAGVWLFGSFLSTWSGRPASGGRWPTLPGRNEPWCSRRFGLPRSPRSARTPEPNTPARLRSSLRCGAYCPRYARGIALRGHRENLRYRFGFLDDPAALPLRVKKERRALASCVLRHFSPAGLGTAAYCRMECIAPFATTRGGYRLHTHNAAAAFGRHQPCWAKPKMAHGHLCPRLLGLVATLTQGSNCALTPFGESGLAFGFGSFVGYRIVVGKHIFPTPICCSVGSGAIAIAILPSWGLSLSWTTVRFITLGVPYFAASRRGAIRAVARGPRPRASVVGGPPPLLLHPAPDGRAPATAVGGKGERCPALVGGAFLSATALGPSCGYGGLMPPASVLWAKTPSLLFGGFCPEPVRCVLPLVARSRVLAPRLPHCSLDVVGGLSN